jgi:hypothetical protein
MAIYCGYILIMQWHDFLVENQSKIQCYMHRRIYQYLDV